MAIKKEKTAKFALSDSERKSITASFEERRPDFDRLNVEATFALKASLDKTDIKLHSTVSRVKQVESFLDKIDRFQIKKPFKETEDLVGIRVICLFLSDIARIRDVIRDSFSIVREDNKVDDSNLASFGYLSVHFIVTMGDGFKGPRYEGITESLFEIQVRTIAMDAWANISHYLDYKADQDIPKELKRDFYALSGMFYVADKHFQLFFEERNVKREQIAEIFEKGDRAEYQDQPINLDTLSAYLSEKFPGRGHGSASMISLSVSHLNTSEFNTIGEVDELLEPNVHLLDAFSKGQEDRLLDVGVLNVILSIVDEKYRRSIALSNPPNPVPRADDFRVLRTEDDVYRFFTNHYLPLQNLVRARRNALGKVVRIDTSEQDENLVSS